MKKQTPIVATSSKTQPAFLEMGRARSEEHTSELQSHSDLVCRLLLEKKKSYTLLRGRTHLRSLPRSTRGAVTQRTARRRRHCPPWQRVLDARSEVDPASPLVARCSA